MENQTHEDNEKLPVQTAPAGFTLMGDDVPGGIFRCMTDPYWTILEVSQGFLNLFGYSREEIGQKFRNRFWEIIDPRDRGAVAESLFQQGDRAAGHRLEYRVQHRDGRVLWVLEQGRLVRREGAPDTFCCILADITEGKSTQEALRLSLERHQIIMDQTDDIIIEWDMVHDSFNYSPKWKRKFGYTPLDREISGHISGHSHIHPDDQPQMLESMRAMRHGRPYNETEFRLQTLDGQYLWCRARLTAQYDEAQKPVKAIGVLIDIDTEKRQAQKLMEIAQRDSLTGLYNKGTSQKLIEDRLGISVIGFSSALMIIDLDNFKQVNDSMGHLFGDAILIESAHCIEKQFRSADVVGRIGGDEFMVYMENVADVSVVQKKAEQIIRELSQIHVGQDGGESIQNFGISCSIGAAISPSHGKNFKELYHNADMALYQAKKHGKNQYREYNTSYMAQGTQRLFPRTGSSVGDKIDSNESNQQLNRLAEYSFRVLYQARDIEAAVYSILEVVGKQFNVSRAYIFEDSDDGRFCTNTFEWCNTGISPQINNLRRISYETDLNGHYRSNFNEDGIFYCKDIRFLEQESYAILAPQGIKSLLQSAIYDQGEFRGFVGFDDCRNNRFWTQDQVEALAFVSEILSVFLMKHRVQQHALQTEKSLCTILDSQSSWIFLTDPHTFRMRYINRRLRESYSAAREGMRCHEVLFHRDAPCADCPVPHLTEERPGLVQEIYNPVLDAWGMTDASRIPWHGETVALVCCHDITKYKKTGQPENCPNKDIPTK